MTSFMDVLSCRELERLEDKWARPWGGVQRLAGGSSSLLYNLLVGCSSGSDEATQFLRIGIPLVHPEDCPSGEEREQIENAGAA